MRFPRLLTVALTTTALVLITIWLLNRIPFTKQFVQAALT